MKLSPLDIRKHEFSRTLRGYDPDEVRAFMETVSQQWEEVLTDLRRAEDRVREVESKIAHYEKVEMALQEALESAKAGAKRSQDHAEERASLIVEEAELKAEQLIQDAEQQRFRFQQDVVALQNRHHEVTARLRHFLMSELEILARHEDDQPIGFMKLMPAAPAEALPTPSASNESAAAKKPDASPPVPTPKPEPTAAKKPTAEASEPEPDQTTYADLYERAAEAEAKRPAPLAPAEPEAPADEGETTWTLRSIVTGLDEEVEPDDEESDTEKDRIRRILEDLD